MRASTQPLSAGRLLATLAALAVLELVAIGLGLTYGSSALGGWELVGGVLTGELDQTARTILWQARMPRVAFAAIVGAALATSGAVFQAVLRNPLADPYILGISGGAALGGTLWMTAAPAIVGLALLGVPAAAFVGALGALWLIFSVARWAPGGRQTTYVLLLTGVIFNAFASAGIMFLKSIVSARKAQELLFYLMGTLAVEGLSPTLIAVCGAIVLACLVALLWFARDLNVMTLGDEQAASLGVDVEPTRRILVVVSSIAVAVAVAFCGLVGFVGLVVPHGLRLVVGPDHRLLLPACALGGAAFMTLCDLVARSAFDVFTMTLPVGVVTAAIGAPLFVVFLWRSLTRRQGGL